MNKVEEITVDEVIRRFNGIVIARNGISLTV